MLCSLTHFPTLASHILRPQPLSNTKSPPAPTPLLPLSPVLVTTALHRLLVLNWTSLLPAPAYPLIPFLPQPQPQLNSTAGWLTGRPDCAVHFTPPPSFSTVCSSWYFDSLQQNNTSQRVVLFYVLFCLWVCTQAYHSIHGGGQRTLQEFVVFFSTWDQTQVIKHGSRYFTHKAILLVLILCCCFSLP